MMLAVIAGPVVVYAADFALVERSLTRQLLGLRAWLTKQGQDTGPPRNSDLSWKLALLQKLETELGSLYELHQTLLESTQDLVAIFDEEGRLLLKNQAFAAALALTGSTVTLEQLRTRWIAEPDAPLHPRQCGPGRRGLSQRHALLDPNRALTADSTLARWRNGRHVYESADSG